MCPGGMAPSSPRASSGPKESWYWFGLCNIQERTRAASRADGPKAAGAHGRAPWAPLTPPPQGSLSGPGRLGASRAETAFDKRHAVPREAVCFVTDSGKKWKPDVAAAAQVSGASLHHRTQLLAPAVGQRPHGALGTGGQGPTMPTNTEEPTARQAPAGCDGKPVSEGCSAAGVPWRVRGLAGRPPPPSSSGLCDRPGHQIHTTGCQMPGSFCPLRPWLC